MRFYIKEDAKVNIKRERCNWLRLVLNVWYGNDSYRIYRYLKALRKYEYELNCATGFFRRFKVAYAKVCWHRIGARYNVNINPNVVGYGFRVPHLVGGGNY